MHDVKSGRGVTKNVMVMKEGEHHDAIVTIDNVSDAPGEHSIR